MNHVFYILGLILILPFFGSGQDQVVYVQNASFEDIPRRGGELSTSIKGWFDCGTIDFPGETPPDIHPVDFWEVDTPPADSSTYLGMVVRDVDSWEAVAQRLETPLQGGSCYDFSLFLARSDKYISGSQLSRKASYYTRPAVFRLWGGNSNCSRKELLAESEPVNNIEWKAYNFEISPKSSYRFIIIEAFYKTPVLLPYNGHILADGLSDFTLRPCPGEEELLAAVTPKKQVPKKKKPKKKTPKKKVEEEQSALAVVDTPKKEFEIIDEPKQVEKEPTKILKQLVRNKIQPGQTIRIKNLYFKADTSALEQDSYPVLDEIYQFLDSNRGIVVEVGGHTNGIPKDKYCDDLSTARAKQVAEYITAKGISSNRLKYKGYGRRKPKASDRTKEGRKKNQRVEIKILSVD